LGRGRKEIKMERSKYNIEIKEISIGEDRTFLITGGKAHIGAVSLAFWQRDKVEVLTLQVPKHKEHILTEELARSAAIYFKTTVTVIMGIHFANATKEMIEEIIAEVKEKFTKQCCS